MQKQRTASRPELHLVSVNRNGQRILQHSMLPIQAPYQVPIGQRLQHPVQIQHQPQIQQSKRVEVAYCKENIPILKPFILQNQQTQQQYVQGQPNRHPQVKEPSFSEAHQIPLRHQLSTPVSLPKPHFQPHQQSISQKDRHLTDISNTMINSAIFTRPHPSQPKWLHNTPQIETLKSNKHVPLSSLFDVRSTEQARPNSAVSIEISEEEGRELRENYSHRNQEESVSKCIKVVDASCEYQQPRQWTTSQPQSPFSSMIKLPTTSYVDERFKQMDELAVKIRNVEEAVARLDRSAIMDKKTTVLQIPYIEKEGRMSQKTVDTDSSSEEENLHNGVEHGENGNKLNFSIRSQNGLKEFAELKMIQPVNQSLQPKESTINEYKPFTTEQSELGSPPSQKNFSKLNFKKKSSLYQSNPTTPNHLSQLTTPNKPITPSLSSTHHHHPSLPSPSPNPFSFNHSSPQPLSLSDFQIGKQLGKGKFGQVFMATHKPTGFILALKILSKQSIKQQKLLTQLTRQLKILTFVKHPNLVSCYGFFSDSSNIYVLLEMCSGGHLYRQMQAKKRFTETQAALVVRQICEGVRYLHGMQILHRDIKPENIILENGIAKICDFGWSVFSGEMRRTVCGTPLYLSPEIVKGEEYDEKIDLWAVGILTYELIVGRIPFKIWSEAQLNKIVNQQVTFPEYAKVSKNAQDFILKALEKDPNKRLSIEGLLAHPFLESVDTLNSSTLFM